MGHKGKRRRNGLQPTRSPWRSRALAALAVVVLVAGGAWWLWPTPEAEGGTPRLVVDRETVDLGNLAFETPTRASFTITNAGDGTLKISDVPRVKALEGC
ncbi:MAG: hypothetical protein HYU51_10465 [Candidatus Rokubacteria bacterium]|nr:hypothetical protein [Candidatus Rokubacteria bacterium]